ncbi:MAG: ABC transporter permease [Patescibacteria group bacterium]|nr:ABC transporter permease [Patescibacteria group bacterium]
MLKLFVADLKMLFRNRQAFIWALIFPLIFTIIFGLFFGKNNSGFTGSITIINQSQSTLAKKIEDGLKSSDLFTFKDEPSLDTAKEEIQKSQLSAALFIPDNFAIQSPNSSNKISVYFDPANSQTGSVLTSFINNYLTQASFQIQNAKPLFEIEQVKTGSNNPFNYFDFVLVGILGMALMNGSIIGISVSISKYREDKILKRITSTPVKSWQFIGAEVLSRLVLNVVQIALILSVGVYGFHAHIYGNIFIVIALAILGGILFQLIGFFIASFAKTPDSAQSMAQTFAIPMMFLAGVFFPIDSLPKWLSSIVQYLPLAPLLRTLRGVALDGLSPFNNPINLIIILGWIILMLAITIFKFRLTDE